MAFVSDVFAAAALLAAAFAEFTALVSDVFALVSDAFAAAALLAADCCDVAAFVSDVLAFVSDVLAFVSLAFALEADMLAEDTAVCNDVCNAVILLA